MDNDLNPDIYWQLEEARDTEHTRPMDDLNYGICHQNLFSHNFEINVNAEGEFSIDAFSWGMATNNWFYTDIGRMVH